MVKGTGRVIENLVLRLDQGVAFSGNKPIQQLIAVFTHFDRARYPKSNPDKNREKKTQTQTGKIVEQQ